MKLQAAAVDDRRTTDRPLADPFLADQRRLVVHCCYHKSGTHWLRRILKTVVKRFDLEFKQTKTCSPEFFEDGQILFDPHSWIDVKHLPAYRGSHMIRDQRDIVVSAYFYHLWTDERWARKPRVKYGGISYHQLLNSLSIEQGLLAEINRSRRLFRRMKKWNYRNSNMLELRYEDVIRDEEYHFTRLFAHYGFHTAAVKRSVRIALRHGFEARSQRKLGEIQERSIMRSGEPGQWKKHFSDRVKKRFKKVAGGLLRSLQYEKNNDW